MKRYKHAFWFLIATALLCMSCLGSDTEDTSNYYDDTAITAFRITSLNQYVNSTTTAGKDTVIKNTLTNPVVFTIDQYADKIYNTDSLPAGCDLQHVLATISCKNNGKIFIRSYVSDTLWVYNSTDSIDFTKAREVAVYSQSGKDYRTYQVTVNMHQSKSGVMLWEKMQSESLPADDSNATWQSRVSAAGLSSFIGAGTTEAYAYSNEGKLMVSKDEGITWVADSLDTDASMLPKMNIAFASWPFAANDSTDYQLLIGTREEKDTTCTVWRKIAEYAVNSKPSKWVYLSTDYGNYYQLPKMNGLSIVRYQGNVLATGDNGKIYVSRDQGITWKQDTAYPLPSGITGSQRRLTTDGEGVLWLTCADSGEVWRGHMIK